VNIRVGSQRLEKAGGKHSPMTCRNHCETPEQAKGRWCTENGEDPAGRSRVYRLVRPSLVS
jgi:hypothetical protein